jgi:phosphoribosylaminoimidazole-succinocarboxamide synthase
MTMRPDEGARLAPADGAVTGAPASEVEVPGITPWRRGKVRAVYEAGPKHLVVVASDRLSAYDVVLPTPIPGKGAILTKLSGFWMGRLKSAAPHHLVADLVLVKRLHQQLARGAACRGCAHRRPPSGCVGSVAWIIGGL